VLRSLQSRVTASFVAVIAAAVIALGIGLSALFGQVLYNQYAANYVGNASRLYVFMQYSLNGWVRSRPTQTRNLQELARILSQDFGVRIQVLSSPDGSTIADYGPPRPPSSSHFAVDNLPRYAPPTLKYGGKPAGTLVVSEPLTDRAYVQQQFAQTVVWIGIAACLFAVLIGGILAERLTAPFRILRRAAARMDAGHLAERVPQGRRDEAGELARQFNQMAARLQESFTTISADRDRLRAFVADVSHELRTPLTALRTFNDLLQNGAGENPATRRDFLAESARQIERLDWLTHNLLDLSRLDAGITQVVPRTADLAETLRHAVDTNAPAAEARGVRLVLDAGPLLVPHDPPRLEQALSNVVSNAIKFSPRGGTVRARLYDAGDHAVAEIGDEGPGIPPEEAPHVFERFYRGRDANRAGEGSGLGLSIARAILDAHGGAITVESTPGHGTIMRLTLPLTAISHQPSASG
jgi:signal transduction histidine kinase